MPKARNRRQRDDHNNVIKTDAPALDAPKAGGYTPPMAPSTPPTKGTRNMNDTADTAGQEANKKSRNLKYSHRNHTGEVQDEFNADVRSVITTVIADGSSVETRFSDFIDPALIEKIAETDGGKIFLQATAFGLKTTIGNSCAQANKLGWGPSDMHKALEDRRATLVDDKEWREGGGGGPRTAHIVDAVAAMLQRETGKPLNPAGLALLKEQAKANPKSFTDNPQIAAEIAAAEMRRAEQKLKEKQAAAAQSTGGSFLSDLAASLGQ